MVCTRWLSLVLGESITKAVVETEISVISYTHIGKVKQSIMSPIMSDIQPSSFLVTFVQHQRFSFRAYFM